LHFAMVNDGKMQALSAVVAVAAVLGGLAREARADDATVTLGGRPFSEPPADQPVAGSHSTPSPAPIVADDGLIAREPELRRSPFRLTLGPTGITTGKGFGFGVGLGADFGTGSVGGRLSASWLRGEGKSDGGSSTPTGDSVGHYSGEITLDLHKRGPIHPVIGMGAGFLHVSRPDARSGFAGMGTGRFALEYALGLEDADVRVGASITGGIVGPVDSEVKDLRAYALTGAHLAIGF
jgi:hypothetical protein